MKESYIHVHAAEGYIYCLDIHSTYTVMYGTRTCILIDIHGMCIYTCGMYARYTGHVRCRHALPDPIMQIIKYDQSE